VTLIVPVKGDDEGLSGNLRSLATLDYPDYELIVVAQCARHIPPGVLPSGVRVLLACGGPPNTSEKIQNMMSAVRHARRPSTVFAFADSDGRVPKDWLRALVAPLSRPGIGASTGYRRYRPDPPDFCSVLRGVWNGAIAGMLGPDESPFAWGGAMAIRREMFCRLKVMERWAGAVSDDYVLSRAVHDAGLRIAYAPAATATSVDHIGFGALLRWTARQMIITRVYHPRLWLTGLAAHAIYCAGMTASAVSGAWWALALQLAPGMWKAARRGGWIHGLLAPVATWLWMWSLAASAFTRTIEWRGRRYTLSAP
jgi:cellulose synthase/poly-beta-1,6-N-acetylglucosamine synthase-like glycosyltransferase